MPELPEVETVRRSLEKRILGRRIVAVRTSGKKLRRKIDVALLERATKDAEVLDVKRIAKYLLVGLSSAHTLIVHLGMSGRLLVDATGGVDVAHTHVVWELEGGTSLRYIDARRFGVVLVYPTPELHTSAELRVLGVDPTAPQFTAAYLTRALKHSRRDLKAFLMDQASVSGLGNIYVCEALYRARLSPTKRGFRVTQEEAKRLHAAIVAVITSAIKHRGTSFSDYVDAEGEGGDNYARLLVYGREGRACRRCKTLIKRRTQAGRSTFWCPKCQQS